MVFCDIVPPDSRVQDFIDAGAVVLDHHREARVTVEAFGSKGVFADAEREDHRGISGAVLSYEVIYRSLPWHARLLEVERLARLIGLADTWQRDSRDFEQALEFVAACRFFGLSRLTKLSPKQILAKLATWGPELRRDHLEHVQYACKEAIRMSTPKGTRMVVVQGTSITSDLAELLRNDPFADLVVGYHTRSEDREDREIKLQFSTRAVTTYDCGALASAYGGGGHRPAAGFSVKDPALTCLAPHVVALSLIAAHEGDPQMLNELQGDHNPNE